MSWDLPKSVKVGEKEFNISFGCDYRVILDCFDALNDAELEHENKIECVLIIFYEELNTTGDIYSLTTEEIEIAIKEMFKIINCGEEEKGTEEKNKPQLMDWKHDFKYIAPSVSRILGYDVRIPDKFTHWWSFLGAYREIGECVWSTIVSIRKKKAYGKKLEKWEQEFYKENKKDVDLPKNLTEEEKEWLDSDW